jgi:hypothetical protein
LRPPPLPQKNLENGNEERKRLAASRSGGTENVLTLECEGEGALLNVGEFGVVGGLKSGESLLREGEVGELLSVGCVLWSVRERVS